MWNFGLVVRGKRDIQNGSALINLKSREKGCEQSAEQGIAWAHHVGKTRGRGILAWTDGHVPRSSEAAKAAMDAVGCGEGVRSPVTLLHYIRLGSRETAN